MKPATTLPTGPFLMASHDAAAIFAPSSSVETADDFSNAPSESRLDGRLRRALRIGPEALQALVGAEPRDYRDGMLALLRIHDLHLAPLAKVSGTIRWQHHPAVADLKWRLEEAFMTRVRGLDSSHHWDLPTDAAHAVRAIAHIDRGPRLYEWLAGDSSLAELVHFIALEGGPDGGFDDLVAICQIGLDGEAKLELARNYWDEMGRGRAADVHTELHRSLTAALGLRPIPRRSQPLEALERTALSTLFATNRALQAEMVGALGLIELQAGPRCRKVAAGLRRVGADPRSFPFYDEHAQADPIHGKDWLDNVIAPLGSDPCVGNRIVEGARWRSTLNTRFLSEVARIIGAPSHISDGGVSHSGQPSRPSQAQQ